MASDHYNEFNGKRFLGVSIILTLIFWAVFTRLLLPFVPTESPGFAYAFAAFTAACLSGVFFLATHMFQLVRAEHTKARRSRGV